MNRNNYVVYHLHTELSLLDSCTKYKDYILKAKELGQKAICFTEHGNCFNWIEKKMYCEGTQYKVIEGNSVTYFDDKSKMDAYVAGKNVAVVTLNPIKFMYGVEAYLTESSDTENKMRDNYHTVLIAKNEAGIREINTLVDRSTTDSHMYYKPRIMFDEFFAISDNVIKISACLSSPLRLYPLTANPIKENIAELKVSGGDEAEIAELEREIDRKRQVYHKLCMAYDYYEVQPHVDSADQKQYNKALAVLARHYGKPLIAGTDTHSINHYKAACRMILKAAKRMKRDNEDEFDLTYKSYDELVDMFERQGVLSRAEYMQAIGNTNVLADSVEEFALDTDFKYPKTYDDEESVFEKLIYDMYEDKLRRRIIKENPRYLENIQEELRVFKKIGMVGFMLFMSELIRWCWDNGIPVGPCRGSVGGSTIAYITDVIDVDPIVWNTVFSRFANEDRKEIGDIDVDISPSQRHLVFKHIIDSFGADNTAYVLAIGTIVEKGTIDEIGRALSVLWEEDRCGYLKSIMDIAANDDKDRLGLYKSRLKVIEKQDAPYSLDEIKKIKAEYDSNPSDTKDKYPELFYYFDGLLNTAVSQSMHPAGIIVSPVTLNDNYGTFWSGGNRIMSINMEEIHEVSLVKYDILGLKNIEIIKDACINAGIKYPKSHEIDWLDEKVWSSITDSRVGIFQFEGEYAFRLLKEYAPKKINDLSLVNACLRPSGESYRNDLIARKKNKNPSVIIDELLKDNDGYLVFQEDTIKFLKDICGLSGSDADNVRRAIGRKQTERLQKALPQILDGYCNKSDKPRAEAEQEARQFLQIIEDSSNYQFGYNHSTGYSMIGYMCAYLRYYHTPEFITAYLNNAGSEDDIIDGTNLAKTYNIKIAPIEYGYSRGEYAYSKENNMIYKGIGSVKNLSVDVGDGLSVLYENNYDDFVALLSAIQENKLLNSRQVEILIKVDFFKAFGEINKLLVTHMLFQKYYEVKNLKKSKAMDEKLDFDIIRRHCEKETVKTFMGVNGVGLVKELVSGIQTVDLPITDRIAYQQEYLGYLNVVDKKYSGMCVVTDLRAVFTPVVTLYALANGNTIVVKIPKKDFAKKQLCKGDVIRVNESAKRNKVKFDNGEYVKCAEKEWWVYNYDVVGGMYA